MINFDESICADLELSATREWLETNGRGGFASATVSGMNTRRYHGLLVAALASESQRIVLLSRLEETLIVGERRYELSTNRYAPGVIHPQGFRLQTGFRLDPFPVFTFRCDDVELEKTVVMLHDQNATVIRYRLLGTAHTRIALEVRPMVALRTYHAMRHKSELEPPRVEIVASESDEAVHAGSHVIITPQNTPAWQLRLAHNAPTARSADLWYERHEYSEEIARGFAETEDLYNPCVLEFELRADEAGTLIAFAADAQTHNAKAATELIERERARRASVAVVSEHSENDEVDTVRISEMRALQTAADAFLVSRRIDDDAHRTIIAGYHWFTDWGRDVMIALPGLTLATNRLDDAEAILLTFATHEQDGLIPNYFPDVGGEPSYNTADATLWFVHAAGELAKRGRAAFVREHIYPVLLKIIRAHVRGTRHRIGITHDGLLRIGSPDIQLTWMDAKIGDHVVTPRDGKPVEIQALWYNALRVVESLAAEYGDLVTRAECGELAAMAHGAFALRFWNAEANCLYDLLLDDGTPDRSVRPNQIFAVSLPHQILSDAERARSVVATVERELLTPYGLRSLSPADPAYRGRYEGDVWSRDTAYHQGTVWAWLMGAFITAHLKVHARSPASLSRARTWLAPLRAHLREAGLGHISEVFDGDSPHTPRGCIAQAWSVAELLRCELEEMAEGGAA